MFALFCVYKLLELFAYAKLSFLKLEVTQHVASLTQRCSRYSAWNPDNHSCGISVTLTECCYQS